jgi:hypothetical protein
MEFSQFAKREDIEWRLPQMKSFTLFSDATPHHTGKIKSVVASAPVVLHSFSCH